MFPYSKREAVSVFDLYHGSNELDTRRLPIDLSLAQLREGLEQRLFRDKLPDDVHMNGVAKDSWGWAYPDGVGPIMAGEWFMWYVRHWKKSPPEPLIKAMVAGKCKEWLADRTAERVPRSVREQFKEDARDVVYRRTPPTIVDCPLLFNHVTGELVLFSTSENVVDSQGGSVSKLLREVTGRNVYRASRSVQDYLQRSRHGVVLPGMIEERYLRWLAEQACEDEWLYIDAPGYASIFQVSLGGYLRATDGHNNVYGVEGDSGVADFVEELDPDAKITQLEVVLTRGEYQYAVRTDLHGNMRAVKVFGCVDYKASDDDVEEAVIDMGEHFMVAHQMMRALWCVYDCTRFTDLLHEQPQTVLWEGRPSEAVITWSDHGPEAEPPPPTPLESAIADAGGGHVESVTISGGGKSVTLTPETRKNAEKALAEHADTD